MMGILDDLHRDHRNLARLLDLLTDQMEILQAEGRPDLAVLRDMVDYVETYPDLVHHPKEDVLFERYLRQFDGDGARGVIEGLMAEHKELKDLTSELKDSIEGVLHDMPLEREAFVAQLADFIARQRRHLDTEEAQVFPLLRDGLSDVDFEAAERAIPARTDPLFGVEVQKQFEALYLRIFGTQ